MDCGRRIDSRGFCKSHYNQWVSGWPFEFDRSPLEALEARIRAKVLLSVGGCWEWQGKSHQSGYGLVKVGDVPGLKQGLQPAHRIMWQIRNGYMKSGLLACHSCDNRACCNPDHIFPGTAKENYDDMVAKGRNHVRSVA